MVGIIFIFLFQCGSKEKHSHKQQTGLFFDSLAYQLKEGFLCNDMPCGQWKIYNSDTSLKYEIEYIFYEDTSYLSQRTIYSNTKHNTKLLTLYYDKRGDNIEELIHDSALYYKEQYNIDYQKYHDKKGLILTIEYCFSCHDESIFRYSIMSLININRRMNNRVSFLENYHHVDNHKFLSEDTLKQIYTFIQELDTVYQDEVISCP